MKISVSLSDDVGQRLSASAKRLEGASVSALTELAIQRLLALSEPQVSDLIQDHRLARRAVDRAGWVIAFWSLLGKAMGRPDRIDNPYAPRQYGDFVLVMLMNRADGREEDGDPFPVHLWPATSTPKSPPPEQWVFARTASPAASAEAVAAKLRDLGVRLPGAPSSRSYTIEKFYIAVLGLASETGEIRERLENAAISLHVLRADRDLPKGLQDRFASLRDDLTHEEPQVEGEGRIHAKIREMKTERAAEIAEEIFDLYFELLEITPFGERRE